MNDSLKLGIGNTVGPDTLVFHGAITSKDSFGRVTDLVYVWARKEHELNPKSSADLRLLIQSMLEFSFPNNKSSIGHLELAIENQQTLVSVRFENLVIEDDETEIEKKLSQYWLNAEEAFVIKKLLQPHDRVEVRFLQKLNLIEWRIIRPMTPELANHDIPSFQVFTVTDGSLMTDHEQFVEMGDLPYENWIEEVYRNKHENNKSGDLFENDESVQDEEEWARVVVERDTKGIDESSKVVASKTGPEGTNSKVIGSNNPIEDDSVVTIGASTLNPTDKNQQTPIDYELAAMREKINQFEKLIIQKEKQNQKVGHEVAALQKKMKDMAKNAETGDSKQVQLFRDKAMQMFEMVKVVKQEKAVLEKTIFDLKKSTQTTEIAASKGPAANVNESPGLILQMEDMAKKVERTNRALEAEKQKMKALSERVVIAEREAQSTGPMVEDLERKVETTLKMAQQHKKETEQVKQRLVQSDAEKNKIKNDLIKAQAQIVTLTKRQAA